MSLRLVIALTYRSEFLANFVEEYQIPIEHSGKKPIFGTVPVYSVGIVHKTIT